jgi:hypothetical protein
MNASEDGDDVSTPLCWCLLSSSASLFLEKAVALSINDKLMRWRVKWEELVPRGQSPNSC